MTTTQLSINGWFAVWPEGGGWFAVLVHGHKICDMIEESRAGSIRAGDPIRARIVDAVENGEVDEHVSPEVFSAVLESLSDYGMDTDEDCVVIERIVTGE